MDSGVRLGLREVLCVHMYVGPLGIYENTHLKPTDGKPRVEGVDERRMPRFPTCHGEVGFHTSDFSSRGRSRGFLRLAEV
jgi:hypothetical protein